MTRDAEFRDRLSELMQSALPDDLIANWKKKVDDVLYSVTDGVEWWLKDELAGSLSGYVQDMADRAIESMLKGNDEMLRSYLKCQKHSWTGRDREHSVIHGRLVEADPIEMRRKLCEAHPELLMTERIADLESQVAGLVVEVNKREAEIERLRERLR